MDKRKELIAKLLIDIKAVSVSPKEPYTYTSGLKGPIYCDNRKVLSHVNARNMVIDSFIELIKEKDLYADMYAGLATAGIAHAGFIADRLAAPMIYIRGKAKGHGKGNQVEGDIKGGENILLVEDLVNQAGSLKTAYLGAKEAGLDSIGCVSIVDYGMENAKNIIKELNIPFYPLTDFDSIVEVALNEKLIDEEGKAILNNWQQDPANWKS